MVSAIRHLWNSVGLKGFDLLSNKPIWSFTRCYVLQVGRCIVASVYQMFVIDIEESLEGSRRQNILNRLERHAGCADSVDKRGLDQYPSL